ncbi:unnamed protein product, partial [Meganyctiphanes norvegica]
SKIKARLVARGFEEDKSKLQTDSPTCSRESVRLLITLASSWGWKCHTVDVQAAYLQGNAISRLVFLKPPKEFDDGSLWQLNKTVYGLCDAAREWYDKVSFELSALGVTKCSVDNSLFFWHVQEVLEGMVVVHVDDFLWCGTDKFKSQVIEEIT